MPRCGCGGPASQWRPRKHPCADCGAAVSTPRAARCRPCGQAARNERVGAASAARRTATCRGCGRRPPSRPRGLCYSCYLSAGVREWVGMLDSPFNARGSAAEPPQQAPPPTDAPPGSEGKIEALAERARLGLALWSRGDATGEGHNAGEVLAHRRQPDAVEQYRARGRRGRRTG